MPFVRSLPRNLLLESLEVTSISALRFIMKILALWRYPTHPASHMWSFRTPLICISLRSWFNLPLFYNYTMLFD